MIKNLVYNVIKIVLHVKGQELVNNALKEVLLTIITKSQHISVA